MRPIVAVAFGCLLLAAPTAQAVPATLTWHMVDGLQDGVLSTQAAPDGQTAVNGVPGASGAPDCAGTGLLNDFGGIWVARTSVSGALYETAPDGDATLYGSPGLAADVRLASGGATLHWVMTLDDATGLDAVAASPPFTLQATLAMVPEAWDPGREGTVIATGSAGPVLLAAEATSGASHVLVQGRHVYELDVPLQLDADTLVAGPRDAYGRGQSLVATVATRLDAPCPQDDAPAAQVMAFTADGHRPSLTLDVAPTLSIDYLHPQVVGGDLVLHASVNSAWGKYDVGSANATVTGPEGNAFEVPRADPAVRFHEHSPRDPRSGAGPIDATFVVPAPTAPGRYDVHLSVKDLAGTTLLGQDVAFEVTKPKESPAAGLALAAAALVAALLVSRRRRPAWPRR